MEGRQMRHYEYPTERTDTGARDERYGPVEPLSAEWGERYERWLASFEEGEK